jgi:hypothetical protein
MLTKPYLTSKFSRLHAPRIALLIAAACVSPTPLIAQQQQQPPKPVPKRVRSVMGFQDIKKNEKCGVEISSNSVRLTGQTATAEVQIASIEDVLTGDDSARLVGGFVGTLTSFGPYGSVRFLSLFRKKLDTLTIQYRDSEGGLHGGILSMHPGEAIALKRVIVAAGAKTTIPIDDSAKPADGTPSASGDQKKSEQKP